MGREEEEGGGRASLVQRWSADRNCFSPIRRHYHAPSCSNGSVKCQTGELSVLLCPALRSALTVAKTPPPTLGLGRFRPATLAATVRLCGEIVVALSPPYPCSLYIAIVLRERGARALFFEGVRVYGECAEKGERQLARREKRQDFRERKGKRERVGEERISVISVDNVVYASKHNDATFAK